MIDFWTVLFSGGAALLVREIFAYLNSRRESIRLSRKDRRDEFKEILDRQGLEIEELKRREDNCREELTKLWRKYERIAVRMAYYEKGKWTEEDLDDSPVTGEGNDPT